MTLVAAVQMNAGDDVAANLEAAEGLLEDAAARGAALAVLPENFCLMPSRETQRLAVAEEDGEGPVQAFLAASARRLGMWVIGGTMPLRIRGSGRVRAACLVYDHRGRRVARYDKIHMFDVRLDTGEAYEESATIEPGEEPVTVDTPAGRVGLTVCYDLRFPELYRALLARGATVMTVPSAFTAPTGEAHWDMLVRARAVENQCFVIAPSQSGVHPQDRRTWGHSMIVGPWGEVLACLPQGAGVVTAELDEARLAAIRERFPAVAHRRLGQARPSAVH